MRERAIFFLIPILMTCVCSCKGDLMNRSCSRKGDKNEGTENTDVPIITAKDLIPKQILKKKHEGLYNPDDRGRTSINECGH